MTNKKIYISGHNGLLGSSVLKKANTDYEDIITASREELDLMDLNQVEKFFFVVKNFLS